MEPSNHLHGSHVHTVRSYDENKVIAKEGSELKHVAIVQSANFGC